MDEFLMKPKIDFAFKEIMMNENARIGFLSAILKIEPADIKETQILNTYLRKEHEEDKQGILDVRILMNNDTEIDTEINLSELKVWADRSLFYISKMYTEQIQQGQQYDVFKKCVSISILDFILFEEPKNISEQPNPPSHTNFYSCFHIWEDNSHFLFTDKMEFHVIELPKLPPELKDNVENDKVFLWAKFISSEKKEDFDMIAQKDPYIKSAYQQLQIISQDKQKRLEYEAREKAVRDHNQMMFEAKESGRKEGIEIGKEQGEYNKSIQIAKNLISLGSDVDFIAKATNLSIEQIQTLQNTQD
jgi:predicted transposase/invertase (TIGR01784 family)